MLRIEVAGSRLILLSFSPFSYNELWPHCLDSHTDRDICWIIAKPQVGNSSQTTKPGDRVSK